VLDVEPGSVADLTGLQRGDILLRIGERPVISPAEAQTVFQTSTHEVVRCGFLRRARCEGETWQTSTVTLNRDDREVTFVMPESYSSPALARPQPTPMPTTLSYL